MAAATKDRPPGVDRNPFRSLIGLWCLLVAVLPVAAGEFGLIPIYQSQRSLLPALAVFFSSLGFAFVFSLRHVLATSLFGRRLQGACAQPPPGWRALRLSINHLLACLILASVAAAATYLWAFESGRESSTFPTLPRGSADAVVLALAYVAMFLLAETAIAIMAVREYLQDVLHLSDADVIAEMPVAANGIDGLMLFDSELAAAHDGRRRPGPTLLEPRDRDAVS